MKRFSFDIDVGGACNLRCPSCAQGNVQGYRLPHEPMAPELLGRIVEKAKAECLLTHVNLFVWSEPLLHPRLPELIRTVQDAGIPCHLSSNLNLLPDADAIMAANPASFKISLSGFSQELYGFTHRGGNIERVKRHMAELVAAKARQRAKTRIYVNFHRYRHNLREEPLLRSLLAELGIGFEAIWAQMLPLEKVLRYVDESLFDFPLTAEDHRLIDHLALPLGAGLAASAKYRQLPCPLRDRQFSIDCQGNVQLCCAGFDARRCTIGPFLAMPLADLQRLKSNHSVCALCMRHGAHVYLTHGAPEVDALALANLAAEDVQLLGLRRECASKRVKKRLYDLYRKLPLRFSPQRELTLMTQVQRIGQGVARINRVFARKSH